MTRGLFVGAAFEIAKDDRRPVAFGEAVDLLVEEPLELDVMLDAGRLRRHCGVAFEPPVPGGGRPRTAGGAVGDLVQPGADRIAHPEAARPLHQDQKRGLEGVLGVVRVGQHALADPHHHRTVPLDQDGESQLGGLAAVGREPLQELAVGQLPDRADAIERPELPPDRPVLPDGHRRYPPPAPFRMSHGHQ